MPFQKVWTVHYRRMLYTGSGTQTQSPMLRFLTICFHTSVQKNSGIVFALRCCVITFVLLPRITHASRLPINAFPIPIQVLAIPYFHPNCPAYPTNTTAEKLGGSIRKRSQPRTYRTPSKYKPVYTVHMSPGINPTPTITAKIGSAKSNLIPISFLFPLFLFLFIPCLFFALNRQRFKVLKWFCIE